MGLPKIDVVFTWVDKSDPVWKNKFMKVMNNEEPHENRYGHHGEIYFSIKSIRKFASFVKNIYLVTDGQIPKNLNINKYKVTVVDHKQILDNNSCYPTFKSNTIESYLYRIPDLSDYFMYFNDDTALGNKITYKQMIDIKRKVCMVDLYRKNIDITKKPHGAWRIANYNAYKLFNDKFGYTINYSFTHQGTMLSKKACEITWKHFKEPLIKNAQNPTRACFDDNINFILLSQLVGIHYKLLLVRSPVFKMTNFSVKTEKEARGSFKKNLRKKPHMLCFNNLTEDSMSEFHKFGNQYLNIDFTKYGFDKIAEDTIITDNNNIINITDNNKITNITDNNKITNITNIVDNNNMTNITDITNITNITDIIDIAANNNMTNITDNNNTIDMTNMNAVE